MTYQKLWWVCLWCLFLVFFTFHFVGLSTQAFLGDEASPLLLTDRMWDAYSLHDIRFLAYPFLFYHDPFRAIVSGTLLHFFGVSPILLRLPGIAFDCAGFWILILIFKREHVPKLIALGAMGVYSFLGTIFVARLAGGDGQVKFFILLSGYFMYMLATKRNYSYFPKALWTFALGTLTMLDTVAFLPAFIFFALKTKSVFKYKRQIVLFTLVFAAYFILWIVLPLLAYKLGIQHYLSNRGLFYYFGRASNGVSIDPTKSLRALFYYAGPLFTLWCLGSYSISWFLPKLRQFSFLTTFAWASLFLLKGPSFHAIMFTSLFFVQAVFCTAYVHTHFAKVKILVLFMLFSIALNTGFTFNANFLSLRSYTHDEFFVGHMDATKADHNIDEAVTRIMNRHGTNKIN